MPNAALRAVLGHKEPCTRYIYDRANGSSVYRGESRRPCCYICFVPPPVIVFPSTCEQNGLCETIGRLGCCRGDNQKMRTGIFTVLLLFNFYALALVLFANFAASEDASVLERSNFAEGVVRLQTNTAIVMVRAFMGLSFVAIRDFSGILGTTTTTTTMTNNSTDDDGDNTILYTWDEFCGNFTSNNDNENSNNNNANIIEPFIDASACQECADTAGNIQRLFVFAILGMIMLIVTNVLRRFPNYDVNCQKTWAMLMSLSAFLCSFWAWFSFDRDCFSVLFRPDDALPAFDTNGGSGGGAPFYWEAGSALVCTFCASVLCMCMLLGHCIVPTPSICYDEEEQEAYEDQHRAIRAVKLPQIIPEVADANAGAYEEEEEKRQEYGDHQNGYATRQTYNIHAQPVVRETVTF